MTLHSECPVVWLVFYPSGGLAMSYPPEGKAAALALAKDLCGFLAPLTQTVDFRKDQQGAPS